MDTVLMAHQVMLDLTSVAAALPDSGPLAPPGIGEAWNRMVGVGKWIALGICVLGLLVIGGKMAFDARRGETTEEISSLIKVMLAVTLVSGGASSIGFITNSAA